MNFLKLLAEQFDRIRFLLYLFGLVLILTFRFQFKHIQSEFVPYVEDALKLTKTFTAEDLRYTTIKFRSLPEVEGDTYIGMCYPIVSIIHINPKFWYDSTDAEKVLLLRHELEHCVNFSLLHRSHKELDDGCPASAFEPYIPNVFCANDHYEYYMQEMDDNN